MATKTHEIRDPIHVFVRLDSDERRLLDSRPFQRLRHIHQLATTFLVYPGATHTRFEHSLGVMELATRIYDVVTTPANLLYDSARAVVPRDDEYKYWRRVLRAAALCHDIGHLPFSHAAEKELLPAGYDHERIGREIIEGPVLRPVWDTLKVQPQDVAKVAVGPDKYPEPLNTWENILAEIIVGDAFGADRMDYLLRDSHHAGVAYGRFDHFRLVDTMRILPTSEDGSAEPSLGITQGGLQSAEALLWARYLMFAQLYLHHVRRIYDVHLKEFLQQWLPGGRFHTDVEAHLRLSDSEVMSGLRDAATDPSKPGHEPARRLLKREHYRLVYEKNPADQERNRQSTRCVYEAVAGEFGPAAVRLDSYPAKSGSVDFPVYTRNERIESSLDMSKTLKEIPTFGVDYVFIDPSLREKAKDWLKQNRERIIPANGGTGDGVA